MIQSFKDGVKKGVEEQSTDIGRWIVKALIIFGPVFLVLLVAVIIPLCNTANGLVPIIGGVVVSLVLAFLISNPILAIIMGITFGSILHFSHLSNYFCNIK